QPGAGARSRFARVARPPPAWRSSLPMSLLDVPEMLTQKCAGELHIAGGDGAGDRAVLTSADAHGVARRGNIVVRLRVKIFGDDIVHAGDQGVAGHSEDQ